MAETCKCGKKKESDLGYCKKCFIKIFEKRIRRELQKYTWFTKKDKVTILDDGTCKVAILKQLVLPLLEQARINVKFRKSMPKAGRIISAENMEDVVLGFLTTVITNKTWKKDKIVRPLRQLTDKEINQYAKLKGLKEFKRKKDEISGFLTEMDKRYTETKYALLKSSEKLLD